MIGPSGTLTRLAGASSFPEGLPSAGVDFTRGTASEAPALKANIAPEQVLARPDGRIVFSSGCSVDVSGEDCIQASVSQGCPKESSILELSNSGYIHTLVACGDRIAQLALSPTGDLYYLRDNALYRQGTDGTTNLMAGTAEAPDAGVLELVPDGTPETRELPGSQPQLRRSPGPRPDRALLVRRDPYGGHGRRHRRHGLLHLGGRQWREGRRRDSRSWK